MKKIKLRNVIVTGLIISALAQATPASADVKIINTIKETTDSKSGVKTVTEIQELSDGSIRQIQTQSDGYVIDDTYYSDGSGIEKMYENGTVFYTDKYEPGEENATYKTLKERLEPEKSAVSNTNKSSQSTTRTGWIKDGDKWIYRYSNGQMCFGWLKDGDNWYYFDVFGHMVKDGRLKLGDKLYLLDSDGRLQENTDTTESAKKTGWVKDGYIMERGDACEDWKYVNSNGENCVGWLQDGGYWYYFDKCGHMVKNNMRKIDGKIYSFDSKGHIEVNMSKRNLYTETTLNHTGPTDGSGLVCATTFYNIVSDANGVCTLTNDYYDNVNIMLCHKEGHYTNDGSYHGILFDKNGDQVFGWYLESTYVSGNVTTGITTLADRWTYYDEKGVQVISASKVIDGKTYSFDSNGYLV